MYYLNIFVTCDNERTSVKRNVIYVYMYVYNI